MSTISLTNGLPTFHSLDAAQHWVLANLLADGIPISPRGQPTFERIGMGFKLSNPRARNILNPARRWSAALAVGEFAWHLSGSNEVSPLAYYAPRWKDFSDDGLRIRGSCYGHRIFRAVEGRPSQWEKLLENLTADPHSRRAVLSLQQPYDEALDPSSKDVPCVTTCQFLQRNGRLDAIVHMRSNDAIWGLPYDVFLFTMFQEMLSVTLHVELGAYYHFAGSMHLYERHAEWATRITESVIHDSAPMPAMRDLSELPAFLTVEKEIRCTGGSATPLGHYWTSVAAPLVAYANSRPATKATQA